MGLKKFAAALLCALAVMSCDVVKQASQTYNMVNCKYAYNSIAGLSVGGVNVSKGLSLVGAAQLTTLLAGNTSSIPVNMTLNLDVTNPNISEAMLNGMQYILAVDGVEFTSGSLSQNFSVQAGATNTLPLAIGFDATKLMTGSTKDAASRAIKNFIGIGSEKSSVSLKIRPSFIINNQTVASPVYIPVEFSFGGK